MASSLPDPLHLMQTSPRYRTMRTIRTPPATILLLQMCHSLKEVEQLHAQSVVLGLIDHPSSAGRLIESYVSMNQIYHASSVFNTVSSPDVFAYNAMIRGLTLGQCPHDSLRLYNELLLCGLKPDNYTYTFAFKACSHLKALFEGKQVHCQTIKAGVSPDTHVHSSLIHMYANSGSIDSAELVQAQFSEENVVVINSMISGYLSQGHVNIARAMFDSASIKDTATWSAMITGYTKNSMYGEALVIFQEMVASQVPVNESTLVSALTACANLGALDQGSWIHMYVDEVVADKVGVTLATSLVDMYAKCGCIDCGYEVFRKMPQKDVVMWGAMISGFAMHGKAAKCLELFDEMIVGGTCPNEAIFVAILTACSHAGCVELGCHYFNQMVHDFGIRPSIEHYGCMVDLLGRSGRLAEAEELVTSMSEEPNPIIWGALLGACRTHRDVQRGELAFRKLVELEPMSGDRYKLAGHMFANAGDKEDANEIRKIIKDKRLETTRGSSFIEVDGSVHQFVVGDTNHRRAHEIYGMLEGIV